MTTYDQAEALRSLMAQRPEPTEGPRRRHARARVIAVASGKGGVGKTNVVVNLAIALSQRGQRTLIYDADLGLANVDVLLGLTAIGGTDRIAAAALPAREALVEGPAGVLILPGSRGLPFLADAPDPVCGRLTAAVAELSRLADVILVDTAAGVSRQVVEFLAAAGEALVVTVPEPTALADAYALVKVAAAQHRMPFHLLVNQAESALEAETTGRRLADTARRFLGVEVDLWGYLPHDASVPAAVRVRVPFLLSHPDSAVAYAVRGLADQICPRASRKVG